MEEEIQELIQKHLPAQVGEVLKQRLAKAHDDEQELKRTKDRLTDLEKRKSQWEIYDSDWKALREEQQRARQVDMQQQIADALLQRDKEHAQDLITRMERVVLAVFANSKLKYTEHETRSDPIIPPGGTYSQGSASSYRDKTTEVEES